jgi:hypothetical protein
LIIAHFEAPWAMLMIGDVTAEEARALKMRSPT